MKIRIATRKSQLALWQTRYVAARLKALHKNLEIEEIHVVTRGDQVQDRPLHEVGGKALFVSEVERYVAHGEADLAVHSLKDVPGDVPLADGCELLCLPKREDPRDVLVTRDGEDLMGLSAGSVIGTTSLRRQTQLRVQRPDLAYRNLRGNVPTRLEKLKSGAFDGIILAAAGLKRLELLDGLPHQILNEEVCLPAVGQGTLAIEGLSARDDLRELLAPLEHTETRLVTAAERAFLKRLCGSCRAPIAGHATIDNGRLTMNAFVANLHDKSVSASVSERLGTGSELVDAETIGQEVAERLLDQGARTLMVDAEAALLRKTQLN